MELSPLAREKLAKIGELTEEEKAGLQYSKQLADLLAEYFTNELSPDDLWKELKRHKNEGRGFILKDAQLRIRMNWNLSRTCAGNTGRRETKPMTKSRPMLKDRSDWLLSIP